MLGRMRPAVRHLVFVTTYAVLACGGKVTEAPDLIEPDAGSGGAKGGGWQVPTGGVLTAGGGDTSEPLAGSSFTDPGCPEADPEPLREECDPLAAQPGCPSGQACYPFVEHPFGDGCNVQRFGAVCAVAGTRVSGDRCGEGYGRCAGGLICVIGVRAGARCAKLCPLDGTDECSDGLICSETDLEGYGVCS